MKVLIVNQTFYPDTSATAYYATDAAVKLSESGHQVTVLTSARSYTPPHHRFLGDECYRGIVIRRVWPFTLGRRLRLLRILDALVLNFSMAVGLLRLKNIDRVIALTSPPLIGWIASLWASAHKIKFIYWIMDVNPDEAIEAGWIKPNSCAAALLHMMLKATLRRAHQIICLDDYMKKRISSVANVSDKISVIATWSLDNSLETVTHGQNEFRTKHGLSDSFVVMYAGNHSICHPLATLLEAARILRSLPNIKFAFVGSGDRAEEVRQFKHQYQLPSIIQISQQNREEIKYCLSAADLHAVVMGEAFPGIVHPCKIYGILAIGRPFVYIGPPKSHITDIMEEHEVGYQVRHGQAEELAEIIKAAARLTDADKASIMQKEKTAAQKFSQETLCSQLVDVITQEQSNLK